MWGRDLTGEKFGKLTVLEKTEGRSQGYILWRCRCACGREILVSTKKLVQGNIRDCGCVPREDARRGRLAEDLTGQVFGALTVLYQAESRKGRTRWVCRCQCGRETTVNAHELKAGKTKSCGCGSHIRRGLDLSGRKFGRLTALYPVDKRDHKGSVYWHCRCECGQELDVTGDSLVQGGYRSCGCLKKELQQEIPNRLHRGDGTCLERIESQNQRRDNTSGFRGVYKIKEGRYRAGIGFKRKRFYIGSFGSFQEAVQARLQAETLIYEGYVKAYREWESRAGEDDRWAKENPLIFEVKRENGSFKIWTNMTGEGEINGRKDVAKGNSSDVCR